MSTQTTTPSSTPKTNVLVERLLDGQVLCLTLLSNDRAAIDAYVDMFKQEAKDWPGDRIGYTISDMSKTLGGVNTPYGRARMNDLMDWRPDLTFYAAVILPNNFILAIARPFLNRLPRKRTYTRICFTREEALNWQRENIAKNKRQS